MSTLLAIDTAGDTCSVALLLAGELREIQEQVGHRHSERVLPMLTELLADADLRLTDCDGIAFGAGPGAFTGLRIACGIAQGLAFGAALKLVAVGNLEALAFSVLGREPRATVLCANDARMREAYCAAYRLRDSDSDGIDGGELIEKLAPCTVPAVELAALVETLGPNVLVGDAPTVFAAELTRLAPSVRIEYQPVGAGEILRLAARRWPAGAIDPQAAAPLYVRDRVALTIEERRAQASSLP
jgi:tRNA threonylcarbamoyladenosine biosynthesis protein TsaB